MNGKSPFIKSFLFSSLCLFNLYFINIEYFLSPVDIEEDSLFPTNPIRKKEGGRRREAENNADFVASNRVIGLY